MQCPAYGGPGGSRQKMLQVVCAFPKDSPKVSASNNIADKEMLDAALISAAQMAEHYGIAQYGTLVAWARQLGREDCASVLAETLAEEKATDGKLTRLAESRINLIAKQAA